MPIIDVSTASIVTGLILRDIREMPVGLYISVPFCNQKCSFCNFASGVFAHDRMQRYVERVCEDMARAVKTAHRFGAKFDGSADSLYFGGGTPSTLKPRLLAQLIASARENFTMAPDSEITVECAPGTLSPEILQVITESGVNRVSLGVQSFVDTESRAVARTHTRNSVLRDIAALQAAGITNIGVDLIAGLPHQTKESWIESLDQAIDSGVPHVSIYLLEVDGDSRLGRELIAGGTRYHAHHVPDDDLTAEFYEIACERLSTAGIAQYEISNFAKTGFESKHNMKYWIRQPYLGFGVDAHSMLPATAGGKCHKEFLDAVRFSTTDELEKFLDASETDYVSTHVPLVQAQEEEFFLGLRLNQGIDLAQIQQRTGLEISQDDLRTLDDLVQENLLGRDGTRVWLTSRGRLLSNEVFAKFIGSPVA